MAAALRCSPRSPSAASSTWSWMLSLTTSWEPFPPPPESKLEIRTTPRGRPPPRGGGSRSERRAGCGRHPTRRACASPGAGGAGTGRRCLGAARRGGFRVDCVRGMSRVEAVGSSVPGALAWRRWGSTAACPARPRRSASASSRPRRSGSRGRTQARRGPRLRPAPARRRCRTRGGAAARTAGAPPARRARRPRRAAGSRGTGRGRRRASRRPRPGSPPRRAPARVPGRPPCRRLSQPGLFTLLLAGAGDPEVGELSGHVPRPPEGPPMIIRLPGLTSRWMIPWRWA